MEKSQLRRARVSARSTRVHFVYPQRSSGSRRYGRSICGQIPTSGLADRAERGHWRWTEDDVDCVRCLELHVDLDYV